MYAITYSSTALTAHAYSAIYITTNPIFQFPGNKRLYLAGHAVFTKCALCIDYIEPDKRALDRTDLSLVKPYLPVWFHLLLAMKNLRGGIEVVSCLFI